jgi:hypothetical protein
LIALLEICFVLVVCYERTICLVCWKSPQTFGFILGLVGLLEILLFMYVDEC